jgi:hypothetical protein
MRGMDEKEKLAASNAARVLSKLGASKGGTKTASLLTPEARKAKAKAAIAARWKRWREARKAAKDGAT